VLFKDLVNATLTGTQVPAPPQCSVPFIRKHHKSPVTGDPLSGKDLVHLHFAKNPEGAFVCPVTGKEFTDHSRICAIRTTGNVFSWDAVNTLCLQTKNLRDLLSDAPFVREGSLGKGVAGVGGQGSPCM